MPPSLRIVRDPIELPEVVALLKTHLRTMHSQSPVCSVHSLDINSLRREELLFWSAWQQDVLVGCAALQRLSADHGELKSMHIVDVWRGQGYAQELLKHLEDNARVFGMQRLSLETGASNDFLPARKLYAAMGYHVCPPFGDYALDPLSVFMTKRLQQEASH